MNLQITVPYQTCPFQCPFCIANNPKVVSAFENLYKKDRCNYIESLETTLYENEIDTIVITGDTEPTLNMEWVTDVVKTIKNQRKGYKIEIQTRNFNRKTLAQLAKLNLDVVALSIHKDTELDLVRNVDFGKAKKRATVVLNSEFNQKKANYTGFDQVTIKQIQLGENAKINEWIKAHQVKFEDNEMLKSNPLISFMYDENCMDSKNRYLILREDGQLYENWATTQPLEFEW